MAYSPDPPWQPGLKRPPKRSFSFQFLILSLLALIVICVFPASALAPVADFTANTTTGHQPLAVQFTDDSTNAPTGWAWYFGDEQYDGAWQLVNASSGWSPRQAHTSVVLPDGSIVLMGGNDGGFKNDVWRSYDGGATWTLINASSGWSARDQHTSVVLPDGSIVLMGGRITGGTRKNDVWRSEDSGATWTEINSNADWLARRAHTSVVLPDGSIVVMGGNDGNFKNDVWRSEDSGATWTEINSNAGWSPRQAHTSVVLPDGSIVVMGGWDDSNMNDVWCSTDDGATWTEINSNADWSDRTCHTSVVLPDGSIVLMGGWDGSYRNDVWRSEDSGATWTEINSNADWPDRDRHTSVVLPDGSIVLMGGLAGGLKNDVWRLETAGSYDQNPVHTYPDIGTFRVALHAFNDEGFNNTIKSDYITVIAAPPPPPSTPPVANFTANTTTGHQPLAVQFTDDSTNTPTGWAWYFGDEQYDGAWQLVNASSGWSARIGHTSVVLLDGEIVLMGGGHLYLGTGIYKNDVWSSDDGGATWTLVNASAGWSSRDGHTSVVLPDGDIVLMGGRLTGGTRQNDVWRSYDGGATWTLVNASAGWSPRYLHTSVVLPDGSIVLMGGWDSVGRKNDVWRSYDGGAHWTLVNASAGWSARYLHASVVIPDGSIMLMGGWPSDGSKNDVWRSEDSGATWTLVNASASWSVRDSHTSVVLPDGSIVLMGGLAVVGRKNDVWRSEDSGATWILVNASAGWSTRQAHTSVVLPDGSIVLMGGHDSGFKNDTWRLETAGSTAQNPVHTYPDIGTFRVALQVFNNDGFNNTIISDYITVTDAPPVAAFTGTPTEGTAPLEVVFTDESTGDPTIWEWHFGDGATNTTQHPVHTYAEPGTYTVNLTVTNAGGSNTAEVAEYITVTAMPTPVPTPRPSVGGGRDSGFPTVSGFGSVSFLQGSTGQVLQNYKVSSPEGTAEVYLEIGTTALGPDGKAVGSITVEEIDPDDLPGIPGTPDGLVGGIFMIAGTGHAVLCSPAGATLSPPVPLTFTFSPEEWEAVLADANGVPEALVIQWYDPQTGLWEEVMTTVDPNTRTITAAISHFSIYAVFVDLTIALPVATATETPAITPEPEPTPVATPLAESTQPPPLPESAAPFSGMSGFIAVLIVIVLICGICGAYYYSKKA